MPDSKKFNLGFEFVVPTEEVIATATSMLESGIQDQLDVAKALLDTTEVTIRTQKELSASVAKNGNCDLAPYFDHWTGDAIEAAERLLKASDSGAVRNVAECLIEQANAISRSKESFLREAQRVGIPLSR